MKILRNFGDKNLLINQEVNMSNDLGWEENLIQFETEILDTVINPIENYETVRYIHTPYTSVSGVNQTDIWYEFYFHTGTTFNLDYNSVGIPPEDNALMLKDATKSFFRLEFYKTPGTVTNNVLTCEPPTRQNRKLAFARNLSLPTGEKFFYNTLNHYIHIPVFTGSNYRNKENMYLFWFADESVLTETNVSGSTTGNTFFMTAKFYNANDGSIIDFTSRQLCLDVDGGQKVNEADDMYYQVDIDKRDYSYAVYNYNGTKGNRIGKTGNSIKFYEKGLGIGINCITPTPTQTPTMTPTQTHTPTPTPTPSATPTQNPIICTTWDVTANSYDQTTDDNLLYVRYLDCTNSPVTDTFTLDGFTNSICVYPATTPTKYVIRSGAEVSSPLYSTVVNTGQGCSLPSYDWYTLENCWDQTTGYTTGLTVGIYVVNDRVQTIMVISEIWKVIAVSSNDTAPLETKIEVVPLTLPTPPYNKLTYCPPVFEYFLSDPYDATTTTPFCSSPGKLTGTYIKTFAPTISSFYDYPIYDHSGNLFEGAGNDYNYFVATSSGVNSYTSGSTPLSNERILIKIDNSTLGTAGHVLDIFQTTCSGGGGGGNL